MSIPAGVTKLFHGLCEAAAAGKLCLVETKRADTGGDAYIICYVDDKGDEGINTFPYASMILGNPHNQFRAPEGSVPVNKNGKPVQ